MATGRVGRALTGLIRRLLRPPRVAYAHTAVVAYDQDSFRGRNDDGSEAAATWKAAANTNWTQNVDETFRVRFLIQETGGAAPGAQTINLYRNLNGAGWVAVDGASTVVRSTASTNITDGADTTEQMAGPQAFEADNNGIDDVNGAITTGAGWAANEDIEVEFAVQIRSADVANGDSVQLRCQRGTTALDTYTNTPTITVNEPIAVDLMAAAAKQVGGMEPPRQRRQVVAY